MLELKKIRKVYGEGDSAVEALKGVSLAFRKSEFVAILGPSGCGKTTMLNILGGLDRYTSGDLLINGKSTALFKPYEWDAYRNNCVGFVFQNYNLIMHQTILENVELALALSGVSPKERKRRATLALEEVGLKDHINKKPNQLSGGQMQRVAIARAIVNNPEIILADEPTGALDSKNSTQIVELLREIAKTRLVVMVTHNDNLAIDYASRTIKMLDGEIIDDTNPFVPTVEDYNIALGVNVSNQENQGEQKSEDFNILTYEEQAPNVEGLSEKEAKNKIKKFEKDMQKKKKAKLKSTSMSMFTAFKLSLQNLFTKKGRTIVTAFAGSIGIIGIALVLSISNGFNLYIEKMQSDVLGQYPISISQQHFDMQNFMMPTPPSNAGNKPDRFPDDDIITIPGGVGLNIDFLASLVHYNKITPEYIEYINQMDKNLYSDITYDYALNMNLINKVEKDGKTTYERIEFPPTSMVDTFLGTTNPFYQMVNDDFMKQNYEVINGTYPTKHNEVVLLVDSYNQINKSVIEKFHFDIEGDSFKFSDIVGQTFRLVPNNYWYGERVGNKYNVNEPSKAMYDKSEEIKIVGIMRIREDANISLYSSGILYRPELATHIINDNINSEFGKAQLSEDTYNLATGEKIDGLKFSPLPIGADAGDIDKLLNLDHADKVEITLQSLGLSKNPTNILIYPKTFEGKEDIRAYLDAYNDKFPDFTLIDNGIYYNDPSAIMTETMLQIVNIISIVLVSFAGVSLVVSSIMIGIITYVSVVERTKEIGILRSIGARRMDIRRVFNAESTIIGASAGILGVAIAYILTIPLNFIFKALAKGMLLTNISVLNPIAALILVVISVSLTFISGLIPANIASKKDPVTSLRAE